MYNVFSTREIGVLKVVNLMLTARQMLIFKCIVEEFIENAVLPLSEKLFDGKISTSLFKCNDS